MKINQIDEIWNFDLADFPDYKTSKIKRFKYIFKLIDNFSKYLWCHSKIKVLEEYQMKLHLFYKHQNKNL